MEHVVLERKIRRLDDDDDEKFVYKTSKAC